MKRIEIKLSLPVVAPLLDVIKEASDRVAHRLVVPLDLDELDTDSKEVWQTDLQLAQADQFKTLLGLFDSAFFATGTIALDITNAEPILRACSAIRLILREYNLKAFTDEQLEAGEVEIDVLPTPEQRGFMCYLFLATLQELIIRHLDKTILGEEEDEPEASEESDDDTDAGDEERDER